MYNLFLKKYSRNTNKQFATVLTVGKQFAIVKTVGKQFVTVITVTKFVRREQNRSPNLKKTAQGEQTLTRLNVLYD